MKFEITRDFGHARRGNTLVMAHPVDAARAYWRGWLRSARRYTEFVAPYEVMHMVLEIETPEDHEYHARHSDPATSHERLEHMGVVRSERERRIVAAYRHRGAQGATSKEVAQLTGIPHVSTSTTITKLVKRRVLAELHITRDNALVRAMPEFAPEARPQPQLQE